MKNKISWICLQEFVPKEILSKVEKGAVFNLKINDFEITTKLESSRYGCFKKSLKCVECKRVGNILRLERQKLSGSDRCHFNLYCRENSKDDSGFRDILMTQDHIIPQSLGGSNKLHNLQTMCEICNFKKADQLPISKQISQMTTSDVKQAYNKISQKVSYNKIAMMILLFKNHPNLFIENPLFKLLITEKLCQDIQEN